MKQKTKLILSSLLIASSLGASETLTHINFEQDEDGNLNPNIYLPVYWDDELYSGIGYTASTSKDIGTLTGFTDSKNGAVSTTNEVNINWLTKRIGNYSIGLQTDISKVKNNEFGYIHDTNDIFNQGSDYWIAFDNDVELDIVKTGIYADYSRKIDNFFIRASTNIFPSTSIDVKQSTQFKPLVTQTGTSTSSTSQDLAYGFKFETNYDTSSFIGFGFDCSYDFNPIKYDVAQLSNDGTNYNFTTKTIDTEETSIRYLAKIYFDKKVMGGLYPTVGVGKISTDVKNNVNGITKTNNNSIVNFGFEKRF